MQAQEKLSRRVQSSVTTMWLARFLKRLRFVFACGDDRLLRRPDGL